MSNSRAGMNFLVDFVRAHQNEEKGKRSIPRQSIRQSTGTRSTQVFAPKGMVLSDLGECSGAEAT